MARAGAVGVEIAVSPISAGIGRAGALAAASVRSRASSESMLAESAARSRQPAIRSSANGRRRVVKHRSGNRFIPIPRSDSSCHMVTTIVDGTMKNPTLG